MCGPRQAFPPRRPRVPTEQSRLPRRPTEACTSTSQYCWTTGQIPSKTERREDRKSQLPTYHEEKIEEAKNNVTTTHTDAKHSRACASEKGSELPWLILCAYEIYCRRYGGLKCLLLVYHRACIDCNVVPYLRPAPDSYKRFPPAVFRNASRGRGIAHVHAELRVVATPDVGGAVHRFQSVFTARAR